MANKKTKGTGPITARITVYPRPEILDPQGKAIASALTRLGFDGVEDVRAGKSFEIQLRAAATQDVEEVVRRMCKDLLVNSVVEDYSVELLDGEAKP